MNKIFWSVLLAGVVLAGGAVRAADVEIPAEVAVSAGNPVRGPEHVDFTEYASNQHKGCKLYRLADGRRWNMNGVLVQASGRCPADFLRTKSLSFIPGGWYRIELEDGRVCRKDGTGKGPCVFVENFTDKRVRERWKLSFTSEPRPQTHTDFKVRVVSKSKPGCLTFVTAGGKLNFMVGKQEVSAGGTCPAEMPVATKLSFLPNERYLVVLRNGAACNVDKYGTGACISGE